MELAEAFGRGGWGAGSGSGNSGDGGIGSGDGGGGGSDGSSGGVSGGSGGNSGGNGEIAAAPPCSFPEGRAHHAGVAEGGTAAGKQNNGHSSHGHDCDKDDDDAGGGSSSGDQRTYNHLLSVSPAEIRREEGAEAGVARSPRLSSAAAMMAVGVGAGVSPCWRDAPVSPLQQASL